MVYFPSRSYSTQAERDARSTHFPIFSWHSLSFSKHIDALSLFPCTLYAFPVMAPGTPHIISELALQLLSTPDSTGRASAAERTSLLEEPSCCLHVWLPSCEGDGEAAR